jgi:hypothetical protein
MFQQHNALPASTQPNRYNVASILCDFLPVRAAVPVSSFPFPFQPVTERRPSSTLELAVTWEHYQCTIITQSESV